MADKRIGWDEGVVTMKLGEKARLDISSDFAYGTQSFPGLIPPNSDLILYVPRKPFYVRLDTDACIARLSSRRSTRRRKLVIDMAHGQPGIQTLEEGHICWLVASCSKTQSLQSISMPLVLICISSNLCFRYSFS
jgi:hypothetical protein